MSTILLGLDGHNHSSYADAMNILRAVQGAGEVEFSNFVSDITLVPRPELLSFSGLLL